MGPLLLLLCVAAQTEPPLLSVVPIGNPRPKLVRSVAQALRSEFNFRVVIEDAEDMPEEAFYAPRARWRAEMIVDILAAKYPDSIRVVAVTEKPISTTKGDVKDWGIAGLGMIGGKACVLSSHYYRKLKDKAKFTRYFRDLALHEFGHTLGLFHCPDDTCLMADAKGNALKSAAKSSGHYCERCANKVLRYRPKEERNEW